METKRVARSAVGRAAGAGAIAIIMIGLAAVFWWWWPWRGDDGLTARGQAAYRARDWDEAAALARRRIRAAPDDREALRLLARSTARLGRDAAANGLFARLGEGALQAEDLFLIGVGLDHAGRGASAELLWKKGLRLEPGHAETIERLIARATARNQLAEAADLAARLARLSGWEFQGELDLAALCAETGEPASAAKLLESALERPEAEGLDRAQSIRYRNLLARCLLRTDRPAEARAVAGRVLDAGPNAEASWLLGRAALRAGDLDAANRALADAGSYRADHPLDAEPAAYIGEERCGKCHAEELAALRSSRHSTTFLSGPELARLPYPKGPVADPDESAVTHEFHVQDDRTTVEARAGDQVLRAVADYAFGSPDHYVSLVGRDEQGTARVLRLSRFQADGRSGWIRTTGHTADADAGQDFLGKPLDRLAGADPCLFCHVTDVPAARAFAPRADTAEKPPSAAHLKTAGPASAPPRRLDRAIGCERCHGPGENHLKAIASNFRDTAIVNPAHADAEGRTRLCAQCHGLHEDLKLSREDPFWIRFQGTTMPWSRCYTESQGAFDCTTCHDPHHDEDRSPKRYNAVCLSCHSGAGVPKMGTGASKGLGASPHFLDAPHLARAERRRSVQASVCPVNATTGCVACHMPAVHSAAIRSNFTDHYIRERPSSKR